MISDKIIFFNDFLKESLIYPKDGEVESTPEKQKEDTKEGGGGESSEKEQETKDKEKVVFSVGDMVEYRTKKYEEDKKEEEQKDGAIAKGEIRKVIRDGKKYRIYNKNLDSEFTKPGEDVLRKSTNESSQVLKYSNFL